MKTFFLNILPIRQINTEFGLHGKQTIRNSIFQLICAPQMWLFMKAYQASQEVTKPKSPIGCPIWSSGYWLSRFLVRLLWHVLFYHMETCKNVPSSFGVSCDMTWEFLGHRNFQSMLEISGYRCILGISELFLEIWGLSGNSWTDSLSRHFSMLSRNSWKLMFSIVRWGYFCELGGFLKCFPGIFVSSRNYWIEKISRNFQAVTACLYFGDH